jgi:hypothetical protein
MRDAAGAQQRLLLPLLLLRRNSHSIMSSAWLKYAAAVMMPDFSRSYQAAQLCASSCMTSSDYFSTNYSLVEQGAVLDEPAQQQRTKMTACQAGQAHSNKGPRCAAAANAAIQPFMLL